MPVTGPADILLVYDRQCPACDLYCRLTRIREDCGRLELVDARDGGEVLHRITDAGLDIDEGMVLIVGDAMYYGDEAIHRLALMSTRVGLFNRIAFAAFRSERRSRRLYPLLKAARNLLLRLLGRPRINNLGVPGNERF